MAVLLAIGYPDKASAGSARRRVTDIVDPGAVVVLVHDERGDFHAAADQYTVSAHAAWEMFWAVLLDLLFFAPAKPTASGAGFGRLVGELEKAGIEPAFQRRLRELLPARTSALVVAVEDLAMGRLITALLPYGGIIVKAPSTHDSAGA